MAGFTPSVWTTLRIFATALLLAGAPVVPMAQASNGAVEITDALLEQDGQLCTYQILRSERKYGIPQRLLASIAATESGRWHKGLGTSIPWPWTINVEGAGYFYQNKMEAVNAVRQFMAQGKRSIDVGCMQVNLMHHPNAFATLDQAFEPTYNVDYAASFLRNNYTESGSWKTAVGYYHSRTPNNAYPYIDRVYSQWYGFATRPSASLPRNTASRSQSASKRYTTFIRVENAGSHSAADDSSVRQVVFTRGAGDTAKRTATRKTVSVEDVSSRKMKIVSVGDQRAMPKAAVVAPAPQKTATVAAPRDASVEATGPLVLNTGIAPRLEGARVVSLVEDTGANNSSLPEGDKRFIRFSE